MKKTKLVFYVGIMGFLLIQAAKATGVQQGTGTSANLSDTTIVKADSAAALKSETAANDLKQDFKNLFSTAITGDAANKARLNPMAVSFVKNYISKNGPGFNKMKVWAKPYFDMMDEVLSSYSIPKELKYLAVIESGLKYNAKSWAGAVGPWAFMPAAAKEYGLRITKGRDERLDYHKSTHAAARLLTDLYRKYGDWLLVIAAYNSGPGHVDRAIKRNGGSKDFWTIQYHLPNETMNHVKKFIGAHYIFEGEGGITTVTNKEAKELLANEATATAKEEAESSTSYKISGRFSSAIITRYLDMDMATFLKYNPGFDSEIAVNGKYELRLPTQKMNIFVAKRYEILEESVQNLLKTTSAGSK